MILYKTVSNMRQGGGIISLFLGFGSNVLNLWGTPTPSQVCDDDDDVVVGPDESQQSPSFNTRKEFTEQTVDAQRKYKEYFDALVNFKHQKAILNPMDPILRGLNVRLRELRNQCIELDNKNFLNESEEPELFDMMLDCAIKSVKERRDAEVKAFIKTHRPELSSRRINSMPTEEIDHIYSACRLEQSCMDEITTKFETLIHSSVIPQDVQVLYQVSVSRSDNNSSCFTLSVGDNVPLGYSLYTLIKYLPEVGVPNMDSLYSGETTFDHVTLEGLKAISKRLSESIKWLHEFEEINMALVGEDCVKVGQKHVSEILRFPLGLSQTGIAAYKRFEGENMPTLFFTSPSVDLTGDPHREEIREIYLRLYKEHDIIGSNELRKTFLDDDEYRTNISIAQLTTISPDLNRIIVQKRLMESFFGAGAFFWTSEQLALWGVESTLECYKAAQMQATNDVARRVSGDIPYQFIPDEFHARDGEGRRLHGHQKETTEHRVGRSGEFPNTLRGIEHLSGALCLGFIKQHTCPKLRGTEGISEPTPHQVQDLYRGGPVEIFYTDTHGHRCRHKNVSVLLETLKSSPTFQTARVTMPGLDETLVQFESELIGKLNTYPGLDSHGFYGRECIDEGIKFLEQWVVKIVHAEEFCISQESIEKSLNTLASVVGPDFSRGCSTGFAGRINEILLQLVSSTGNNVEAHLTQFEVEKYNAAKQEVSGDNTESAMAARDQAVPRLIGIIPNPTSSTPGSSDEMSFTNQRILTEFSRLYSPTSVFECLRKYVSDEFWRLNREREDEDMYQFLIDLGFGPSDEEIHSFISAEDIPADTSKEDIQQLYLNKQYRINGNEDNRWQYAFFRHRLTEKLITYMMEKEILVRKPSADSTFILPNRCPFKVSTGRQPSYRASSSSERASSSSFPGGTPRAEGDGIGAPPEGEGEGEEDFTYHASSS